MSRLTDKANVGLIDLGGVGAALGLLAGAYWVAVRPVLTQRETRAAQQQQIAELRAAVEEGNRTKDKAEGTIARLNSELAGCEVQLLPASTLNRRLVEIGELASKGGLLVETLRGDDAKVAGQRMQVPIHLIARGSYPACAGFLQALSGRYRDTAVERFVVAADRSDSRTGDGQLTVDLTWFAVSEGALDMATVPNP